MAVGDGIVQNNELPDRTNEPGDCFTMNKTGKLPFRDVRPFQRRLRIGAGEPLNPKARFTDRRNYHYCISTWDGYHGSRMVVTER